VVIPVGRRGAELFQPGINAVSFVHFANIWRSASGRNERAG